MNVKRFILILIGCTCAVFTLYILSLDRPMKEETLANAVKDYREIQQLLKEDEIAFDGVGKLYKKHLAKMAKYVDEHNERFLDEAVWESINRGKKGNITKIAAELVDKMIVRLFFYFIEIEIETMKEKEVDRDSVVKKVRICYQVLKPMVVLSDQWLKAHGALEKRAEVLLNELDRGLPKPKAFITLLKGAFLVSTLQEIEAIEAIQQTDKMRSLEHMAAAKMYYDVLFEDHAVFDRKSSILMIGEFSNQPKNFNTDLIRSEFKRVFGGLISELKEENFDRKKTPSDSETEGKDDQA